MRPKKKEYVVPISWKKKSGSVGRIEILFYFEILFHHVLLRTLSIPEIALQTFQMGVISTADLYFHKTQGRNESFSNKTFGFTFIPKERQIPHAHTAILVSETSFRFKKPKHPVVFLPQITVTGPQKRLKTEIYPIFFKN